MKKNQLFLTILTISVKGIRVVDRDICVVSKCFFTVAGIMSITAFGKRLIIFENKPLNA